MNEPELAKIRLPIATFLPGILWVGLGVFLLLAIPITIRERSILNGLTVSALSAAGSFPVVALICIVCALTYHVRVHSDGVSSYNPYGSWKREFMTWDAMSDIRRVRVLGVRYVRIAASSGANLWIPARVFDGPTLLSAVMGIAPESQLASWIQHDAST